MSDAYVAANKKTGLLLLANASWQKVVTKANLSHTRAKTLKSMTCDEFMNEISVVVGPCYQRNKVSGHVIRKKSISGF